MKILKTKEKENNKFLCEKRMKRNQLKIEQDSWLANKEDTSLTKTVDKKYEP